MLYAPQLAGAKETHLDLVHHQQHAVPVQHALELDEEIFRRYHITAGTLDGLNIKRRVFALVRFGVPDAVVFGLEQALELLHAERPVFLLAHALGPAKVVRELHELRPVAKVPEAAPVTVTRRNRRGPQRAPVVTAFEGEHQAFAAAGIAHQFERIFNRLRTADVEMHTPRQAPLALGVLRQGLGQFYLGPVQVLAGHLGQRV